VETILKTSGWSDVDIQPLDVPCGLPESDLLPYLSRLGPVGLLLQQEPDERLRAQVVETVRAAFEQYLDGGVVRFSAACWLASARNGVAG
jgi:hypothetical protein